MSTRKQPPNEHRCQRCGKPFTSALRLQHHEAAEHAPKTLGDIRTSKDIPRLVGKGS